MIVPVIDMPVIDMPSVAPALVVAQGAGQSSTATGPLLLWLGVLIVLVFGAGIAVMLIRKRLLSSHESRAEMAGSLFEQLRRMHAEGELSDEEYDRARRKLAGRAAEAMDAHAGSRLGGKSAAAGEETGEFAPRKPKVPSSPDPLVEDEDDERETKPNVGEDPDSDHPGDGPQDPLTPR